MELSVEARGPDDAERQHLFDPAAAAPVTASRSSCLTRSLGRLPQSCPLPKSTTSDWPAPGSSHRTRTQGHGGGMLTACLVNPDDLDAVTRIVISNEGCDVFG